VHETVQTTAAGRVLQIAHRNPMESRRERQGDGVLAAGKQLRAALVKLLPGQRYRKSKAIERRARLKT